MNTRLPCTVSRPIELPGASAPPLIMVLPTTPLPASVPPAFTVVSDEGNGAVHRQRAAVDGGRPGIGVGAGQCEHARPDLGKTAVARHHA